MDHYAKSANEIANEYARRKESGSLSPAMRPPRTGTLSIWNSPASGFDLSGDPDFQSLNVTVQVQGPIIIATDEQGAVEVYHLRPGAYVSFVYDDEG